MHNEQEGNQLSYCIFAFFCLLVRVHLVETLLSVGLSVPGQSAAVLVVPEQDLLDYFLLGGVTVLTHSPVQRRRR